MSNVTRLQPKCRPIAPRRPNADVRSREHLTPPEVDRLVRAAGKTVRYPRRDAALISTMYRHGLRVAEVVELARSDLDLNGRT